MSDTTPRDQLAQIINEHMEADVPETVADKHEPVDADYAMSDAIIAAGWRPPARTVTTVEELDALPDMTVILEIGRNWRFVFRKLGDNYWVADGIEDAYPAMDIKLPATVLYEPEETE